MGDSERLNELHRQKKFLLEHLDWLNREIDQESARNATSPSPNSQRLAAAIPANRPVSERLDLESKPQPQVAADLYSELGPDTKSAVADTKRGCLIFGALAFAGLAGLVAYVIFWYR